MPQARWQTGLYGQLLSSFASPSFWLSELSTCIYYGASFLSPFPYYLCSEILQVYQMKGATGLNKGKSWENILCAEPSGFFSAHSLISSCDIPFDSSLYKCGRIKTIQTAGKQLRRKLKRFWYMHITVAMRGNLGRAKLLFCPSFLPK